MPSSRESKLIIFPPSSGCEVLVWLTEQYQIPVRIQRHSVPFFTIAIKLAGGFDYPFLSYRGQKLSSSLTGVPALEAMVPLDRKLAPSNPADGPAAERLWVETIGPKLAFAVSRWAYRYLLPNKALTFHPLTAGAPAWQRGIVWLSYPLLAKLMGRVLGFDQNPAPAMEQMIQEAFGAVDQQLSDGRPYLFGDTPSYVDFGFAGLGAPAVLQPGYAGGLLPALEDAPEPMHALVQELRARPSGELIDRLYANYRQAAPHTDAAAGRA